MLHAPEPERMCSYKWSGIEVYLTEARGEGVGTLQIRTSSCCIGLAKNMDNAGFFHWCHSQT